MKHFLTKIFYPNKIIGFLLFNLSTFLLIYVFSNHLEETPLAYIAYLLSTYALIIFCLWFYKACQFGNNFLKKNSKLYNLYRKNHKFFLKRFLYVSFTINFIYGLFKLFSGIYYKSAWFITFTVYYLLLCFMRVSLVVSIKNVSFGHDLIKEYKKLKLTGIVLLFLDLILSGMIILIIHQNQTFIYPGNLIYFIALYDFYLIITAFINVFKYRHENSPVLSASKCINLTVAMISILSLEVAMIYQFGNNDSNFKTLMISLTGFVIAVINSLMAIFMIIKAKKNLESKEGEFK